MTIVTFGLQPGATSTAVSAVQMREDAATTNYVANEGGSNPIRENTGSNSRRWLFKVTDFTSTIPGGATINDASFLIYSENSGTAISASLYRVLADWTAAQATWTDRVTATAWSAAGGEFSGTVSATTTLSTTTLTLNTFTAAQLITDVANMYAGSNPLYGWILKRTSGSANESQDLCLSNHWNDIYRPYLSVDYSVGGGGGLAGKRRSLLGMG